MNPVEIETPTDCKHTNDTLIHTGDGTPVSYCPDCGRNEVAGSAPDDDAPAHIVFFAAGSLDDLVESEGGEI